MKVGTIISGKYEIEHEIKRGGFGIIYQGIDTNFGKAVAIKTIDPRLLNEAKFIDMFQQEAVNIARLNHQNIVQVFDIKREDEGQIFIIMELIDGYDLMSLLRACRRTKRALPIHLAVHIISEVCNGLDYAHNRRDPETNEPLNLVHKDVSPLNIMLTKSGEVKIIDFGMANFISNKLPDNQEVQIQGNIRYMAPEQIRHSDKVDRRADIFALGVILYETLTGQRLIKSKDTQEIIETLVIGNYDISALYQPNIPTELQKITRTALQHNREKRYTNANQMYRELLHYLILTAPAANFMNELSAFIAEVDPAIDIESNGTTYDEEDSSEIVDEETKYANGAAGHQGKQHLLEDEAKNNEDSPESTNTSDTVQHSPVKDDSPGEDTTNPETSAQGGDPESEQVDPASNYYSFVEDVEEDDQRTIIDIVRLSARTHKKGILATAITLILSFLCFTVVDTFANFTQYGTTIYDFLFPPAIKIVSIPEGAQVYLDDKPMEQSTPLSINKISPGVHKLMLVLPQYESIIKSINVPSKGDLVVAGETKRHASRPYILRFKNKFEIISEPAGANIIVDGIKLNQTTPATVYWDVKEEPTEIELELPGLPKLTGLSIDSMQETEYVEDRRFWQIEKLIEGRAHYNISGTFHKKITLTSSPQIADIYHNASERPVGVTGLSSEMLLTIGSHSFTFKKEGYLPASFELTVDEKTDTRIKRDLFRNVRIFAKDATSNIDRDLGATLTKLSGSSTKEYNRKTPAIVQLGPYTYRAVITKPGYHDYELEIKPTETSVVAHMQPVYVEAIVEAVDAITGVPINSAEISYKLENATGSEQTLGITDPDGKVAAKLAPGTYQFSLSKEGYQNQTKNMRLATGSNNKLTFRLTAMR